MSSEFFHDWSTLYANLDRVEDEDERSKYRVRMAAMLPKMVDVLDARLTNMVTGAATAAPMAAPAPIAVVPDRDDYSYDDFAELFEKYNRNVADSLRVWFKDIEGGFDASDPAGRVAIYRSATDYLDKKSKATAAPGVAPSGNRKPYVAQSGDAPRKRPVPCPDCGADRTIQTRYGLKYRCEEHDYWSAKIG